MPITGFAVNVGVNVLGRSLSRTTGPPDWVETAARIAAVTPPGFVARAMDLGAEGDLGWGLLTLLGAVLWFLVLLRLWVAAMDRLLSTSPSSAGGSRKVGLDLFGGVLSWLPRTAPSARSRPRSSASSGATHASASACSASSRDRSPSSRSRAANTRAGLIPLFLASLPATTIATAAANLWGYDGARYWVQVAAPDDPRSDLYGKVLARIITMGTITLGLLVVATLITRRPELYVPGLAFAVAGGGLVLGVAVPFSIITPVPLPEEAKNLFAGGRGGGSVAQILPTVLIIGLATGVLLPLGYLTAHFIDNVGALVLVALLQVGIGVGSAWIGMRLALRRLRHREPELLAALTRG